MNVTFLNTYNDEGMSSKGKNVILHNINASEPENEDAAFFIKRGLANETTYICKTCTNEPPLLHSEVCC